MKTKLRDWHILSSIEHSELFHLSTMVNLLCSIFHRVLYTIITVVYAQSDKEGVIDLAFLL